MNVAPSPKLTGLHTCGETVTEIGRSVCTVRRWEQQGLPVICVGARRWHDAEAARTWPLSRERRHEAPEREAKSAGSVMSPLCWQRSRHARQRTFPLRRRADLVMRSSSPPPASTLFIYIHDVFIKVGKVSTHQT